MLSLRSPANADSRRRSPLGTFVPVMSLQSILPLRALGFIGKLLIAMALSSGVHELLYQIPDLSWIWEALLILLIFANFKNLPFAWHVSRVPSHVFES